MKKFFLLIFLTGVFITAAQTGEDPLQKVLKVLSADEFLIEGDIRENLNKGAWEALSYLQEKEGDYVVEDLQEAVPDYYNFKGDEAIIKLINPQNYNEYGVELKLGFTVTKDGIISIYAKDGVLKDQWQLLYLDSSYMALDMGDIRLFFTHTPIQE